MWVLFDTAFHLRLLQTESSVISDGSDSTEYLLKMLIQTHRPYRIWFLLLPDDVRGHYPRTDNGVGSGQNEV